MPRNTPRRRYTADNLVYEAFYVALRNSLIVAFTPVAVFIFMAAVLNYSMPESLMDSIVGLVEIIFVLSFFINFLYYVFFIRIRRIYSAIFTVLASCGLAFLIFFSQYKDIVTTEHEAIIFGCWFLLLATILIVNKFGFWSEVGDDRYDQESWLYKHELAKGQNIDDEPELDPEARYRHKYIDTDVYASDAYADEEDERPRR